MEKLLKFCGLKGKIIIKEEELVALQWKTHLVFGFWKTIYFYLINIKPFKDLIPIIQ